MVAQHDGVLIRIQLLLDVPYPLLLPAMRASRFPDHDPYVTCIWGAGGASGCTTLPPSQLQHTCSDSSASVSCLLRAGERCAGLCQLQSTCHVRWCCCPAEPRPAVLCLLRLSTSSLLLLVLTVNL